MRLFFRASKKKKCGIKNRLFNIFGTNYDRVERKDTSLLKTGLYFSFFMRMLLWSAYSSALQRKKDGIKNRHFFKHFLH